MNIILTGGSNGLGLQIARALSLEGAKVINLDKSPFPYFDPNVSTSAVDLSSPESIIELTHSLCEEYRDVAVHAIINNANAYYMQPLGSEINNLRQLLQATNVNFLAPLLLVNGLISVLSLARYPKVINIGSGAAEGAPFCSHYCMSKGAIRSLTHAINEEYRINGNITSTYISLGTLDTGISIRSQIKAITPKSNVDPVISSEHVAKVVTDLVFTKDECRVDEIVLNPHKSRIFNSKA
jgi:NAD(P)-dependent dehydrogenase (short-subunit alcohol dehydrogenase family)